MIFQISSKIRSLVTSLTPEENQALYESIKTYGCIDPLIVWERSPQHRLSGIRGE